MGILTWNVQKTLTPRGGDKDKAKDKLGFAVDLFERTGADFFCLQEVGAVDDATVPLIKDRFANLGQVYACGSVDGPASSSTMVIVRDTWVVESVVRHPSGRALAVRASQGGRTAVVVSVYMPSGLDGAPRKFKAKWAQGSPAVDKYHKREVAAELYNFVKMCVDGYTLHFVAGDLNETRSDLDRVVVRPPGDTRPTPASKYGGPSGLVAGFLRDGVTDVFRWKHPSEQAAGYTCRRAHPKLRDTWTLARLDYLLAPDWLCSDPREWEARVLDTSGSDHNPAWFRYSPQGASKVGAGEKPEVWTPNFVRVRKATKAEREAVYLRCNTVGEKRLKKWPKYDGLTPRRARRALDKAIRGFTAGIRRALEKSVPKQRPRECGGTRPLTPTQKSREILRALRNLQGSLLRARSEKSVLQGRSHKRIVGGLQNLLGPFRGILHDDEIGLWQLYDREEPRARKGLEEAFKDDPDCDDQRSHLDEMFKNPRRVGEFFEKYLKDSRRATLNRATRVDGTTTLDPEEYKPIIRRAVLKPMNVKAELQPPFDPDNPTPASADARARGCRPEWWDRMYSRDAKGINSAVFAGIMQEATCAEVRACGVEVANGGKAPGHDGCDIDLWKLLTTPGAGSGDACLRVLTRITNDCLALAHIPKTLKHGWITMVPKVKADGSFSREAAAMRPITVLPEIGKIISRILAGRLQDVLVRNPSLLTSAQRGFIRDGSADQCVDVVLDVIEDSRQHGGDLFLSSYDQAKAYDSVQEFSIRASLERFNMPESFIQLVVSGLHNATSCVRTAGGLTKPFTIRSGVRQGDPLAPLIFMFVTDALHEGLLNCPGKETESSKWGYTFKDSDESEEPVRICSSGYCDDAVVVATTPEAMQGMHGWVREFFGAHCAQLNVTKTELVCSTEKGRRALAGKLFSVDGVTVVVPRPATHTVRYLGIWLNLVGDWSVQIGRMRRTVWFICSCLRRAKFRIPMSVVAITQALIPRLRGALLVATIPRWIVRGWDTQIRKAVLTADEISMRSGLNSDAFHYTTGLPCLEDLIVGIRGEGLLVSLNADYPAARTCAARVLSAAAGGGSWSRRAATQEALELMDYPVSVHQRDPDPIVVPADEWDLAQPRWSDWTPYQRPVLQKLRGGWTRGLVRVYTDGSTLPGAQDPSGFAAVVTLGGEVLAVLGGPVRASGDNFLAELVAIAFAILVVPVQAPLWVGSDSEASIGATNKSRAINWLRSELGERGNTYALPQRARILSAARPVMNMIRAMLELREAPLELGHVKAHSNGTDFHSRMNDHADRKANEERLKWSSKEHAFPEYLWGEERYRLRVDGFPVVGSYFRALMRSLDSRRLLMWVGPDAPAPPVGEPVCDGLESECKRPPDVTSGPVLCHPVPRRPLDVVGVRSQSLYGHKFWYASIKGCQPQQTCFEKAGSDRFFAVLEHNGNRFFGSFESFDAFWEFYRVIPDQDRHAYTLNRSAELPGEVSLLYFDVEWVTDSRDSSSTERLDELDRVARREIRRVLPQHLLGSPLVEDLGRSYKGKYKNSFHVFYPTTFESNAKGCMADWVRLIIGPLLEENELLCSEGKPIVDMNVYTRNRAFRFPGSTKYAERTTRPLPTRDFAHSIRMGDLRGSPDVSSADISGVLAQHGVSPTVRTVRRRGRSRNGVAVPANGLEQEIQSMLRARGDQHTVVSFNGTRYRGDTDRDHGRVCLVGGELKRKENCFFTITDGLVKYHCFDSEAHPRCASVVLGRLGREAAVPGHDNERWKGELPPKRSLQDAKHTKRLALSNSSGMASLARTVRQINDPWIRRFFPLLATEWLPVERRLYFINRGARGFGCKLCGADRDSVRHIYTCRAPSVRNEVLACRARVVSILRSAGVKVTEPIAGSAPAPPTRLEPDIGGEAPVVVWIPLWFDIDNKLWMGVAPPWGGALDLDCRDRLADLIGVTPRNLYDQLGSKWTGAVWEVRPPGDVRELVGRIRLELVYGALRAWVARCRAMAKWWESPAACVYRARHIRARAVRERTRREKRDTACLEKWAAKRRARKRKRKHPRPKPGSTIATRLRRKRVRTDRGCLGLWSSRWTLEEYEEELARNTRAGGRSGRLPWF